MAHHAARKRDEPRQQRRRRALERFSVRKMTPHPPKFSAEQKVERQASYDAYVTRKGIEKTSLERHLKIGRFFA